MKASNIVLEKENKLIQESTEKKKENNSSLSFKEKDFEFDNKSIHVK